MATMLTFEDACNVIKEKYEQDPNLIDAVDKLLGITMILSPVVFGPVGAPALALLGVKNEVVKIGRSVYEKLTGKQEKDPLARYERMGAAYCLIC